MGTELSVELLLFFKSGVKMHVVNPSSVSSSSSKDCDDEDEERTVPLLDAGDAEDDEGGVQIDECRLCDGDVRGRDDMAGPYGVSGGDDNVDIIE